METPFQLCYNRTAFYKPLMLSLSVVFYLFIASCSSAQDSTPVQDSNPMQDSDPVVSSLTFIDIITNSIAITDVTGSSSVPVASINVYLETTDNGITIPPAIVISGITNVCSALPCTAVEDKLAALSLAAHPDTFALPDNVASTSILIPDQPGAAAHADVHLGTIALTRLSDGVKLTFNVIVHYHGTPVAELIAAAATPVDLIHATFGGNALTLTLDGNALAANGTNADTGTGVITSAAKLPAGKRGN